MSTERLEELILYISQQCNDDPHFGATKLNKILFFADFLAYGYLGRPISEATYVNQEHGPVPRQLLVAQRSLTDSRRAILAERTHFRYTQKRLIPLISPNLDIFSADERHIIDETIRKLEDKNATELSELTHEFRPWRDTSEGEDIPFSSAFVMDDLPATRSDKEWALARIAELEPVNA